MVEAVQVVPKRGQLTPPVSQVARSQEGVDRHPHIWGLDRNGKSVRERRLASGIRPVDSHEHAVLEQLVDELGHPVDVVHTSMLPSQHSQQHQ